MANIVLVEKATGNILKPGSPVLCREHKTTIHEIKYPASVTEKGQVRVEIPVGVWRSYYPPEEVGCVFVDVGAILREAFKEPGTYPAPVDPTEEVKRQFENEC